MSMSENREDYRTIFFDAWEKHKQQKNLDATDRQIVEIIKMHPEFHHVLAKPDEYMRKSFDPEKQEVNPFLHFALHMTIDDLLKNDEPKGFTKAFQELQAITADPHQALHQLMEVLANQMWMMQNEGKPLDPAAILKAAQEYVAKNKR